VALARVLADLAHQMNTPLGVCVTAASTLADRTQHVVAATASGTLTRSELDQFATTADALVQSLVANLQRVSRLVRHTEQASAAAHAQAPAPLPDAAAAPTA
jgi:K+-sensing histidine kinase KdpD